MKLLGAFRGSRTFDVDRKAGGAEESAERIAGAAEVTAQRKVAEGDALLEQGNPEAALQAYRQAIDLGERSVDAHVGEGRAYLLLDCLEEAEDCLRVAIALEPQSVEAMRFLAETRLRCGDMQESAGLLQQAAAIAPDRSEIVLQLARLENRSGNIEAAIASYRRAIERWPGDAAFKVNLGLIHLQQLGEPGEAERHFRAALEAEPSQMEALANLGLALQDQGRFDEAFQAYERGLVSHPDCAEFKWNRALAHLSLGSYAKGWSDYGLRFQRAGGRRLERFAYPEWDGRRLYGGRLLVLAEQGLGDEIMFASCIPDLEAVAAGIVLECSPRLEALFRRSFPTVKVHGADRHAASDWLDAYPDIMAKTACGTLPRFFRSSDESFSRHCGYLRADSDSTRSYRERMEARNRLVRVGLSWRAGTRATRGAMRSVPKEALQPLFAIPGIEYVSLQPGMTAEERSWLLAQGGCIFEEALGNLDEEASLISALDLVITADNTNAHLSGALGQQCWVLLNESPEWRWLRSGERSPWYPSLELFRSVGTPRWANSICSIAQRLRALVCRP